MQLDELRKKGQRLSALDPVDDRLAGVRGSGSAQQFHVLTQGGFDFRHYHQESFDIATLNEASLIEQVPMLEQTEKRFSITLSRSGKTFSMSADETVLVAARQAGAIVPSSCSQGVCGTRKTAVLQGTGR